MSYHAAVVEWEQARAQRDNGVDLSLAKKKSAAETKCEVTTVRQVCDTYLAGHIKHRKPKGQAEVTRIFKNMLTGIENLPADQVTRKVAFSHIKKYEDTPVLASALRAELGAAWDYCLDSGDLPDNTPNWWRQILKGKLKTKGKVLGGKRSGKATRALSPSETGEVIRWLPNFSRNIQDILTLYLWTGTRGAESVAMMGSEVSEEATGLWWTIPKIKTKNARHEDATDHRVPLIGRAAEVVRSRKKEYGEGYLFPSPSENLQHIEQKAVSVGVWYHMPYCETRKEEYRPRLPVTHWTPHDLRRTARTFLSSLGCPVYVAEVILGHMLKGVERAYNRYTFDKERLEWLGKLDKYLEKLANARPVVAES